MHRWIYEKYIANMNYKLPEHMAAHKEEHLHKGFAENEKLLFCTTKAW